ncbi:hypothetical protein [Streptomyces olivoreticuli]|uniref:hypothetical protein n=1 Tax=Streptomyces olivoreticuli TaxID=68246 RepID=UPI0013C3238F|nr:hypothetical protein [Streptomyces olivoreticuli]
MPTYWSPLEKALRRLDSLRKAGRETAAIKLAVDLVVRHQQLLGPMARRAGVSAHRLRKAVYADLDVAALIRKADEYAAKVRARESE